ncbi:hypothetical protein ITP53_14910 [Nonomuraea sp. K274]|uniref:Uncharacterized protein n=1 Tax=Nonomuraea cypriaca TaxID=1187855 RepID=A0A931A887_9ACTN|nr:hypothetical protein [Nonomuraea cypriaca]MBF8187003.1 hypothetical protein [Nonomuraea cypriaca]
MPLLPKLRPNLDQWLEERPYWPTAADNPALYLKAKVGRISARSASAIIARNAGLDDTPPLTSCAAPIQAAPALVATMLCQLQLSPLDSWANRQCELVSRVSRSGGRRLTM